MKCHNCYRGAVWEEHTTRTVQKVCPACRGRYKDPPTVPPMSAAALTS